MALRLRLIGLRGRVFIHVCTGLAVSADPETLTRLPYSGIRKNGYADELTEASHPKMRPPASAPSGDPGQRFPSVRKRWCPSSGSRPMSHARLIAKPSIGAGRILKGEPPAAAVR